MIKAREVKRGDDFYTKGPKVKRGNMDKLMAALRKIKNSKRVYDDNIEEEMRSFGMID